jgi:hypothetical protein
VISFIWPRRAALFTSDWFRSTGLFDLVGGLWDCCHGRHTWVPFLHGNYVRGHYCRFCQRDVYARVGAVEESGLEQAGKQSEAKPSCQ